MTMRLIVPDEVPIWVPGQLTVRSPEEGWPGISVRGYRYAGLDVTVPPVRDYVIVAYRRGTTAMRRQAGGEWVSETMRPGDVSLLTRAAESHWIWPGDIEVVHVYLTAGELAATCREMYEREVEDVELLDEVKADDPAIHAAAIAIAQEAAQGGAGSALLVGSLSCQLAVHILRRHARVLFREPDGSDGLTFRQERAVPRLRRRAPEREHHAGRPGRLGGSQPVPFRPHVPPGDGDQPARVRAAAAAGAGPGPAEPH